MPRYARARDLLRLALEMQASAEGLTLDEIRDLFAVDRRTATRMRDAVRELFPEAEERRDERRRKHWRIPSNGAHRLVRYEAEELAALDVAARTLARAGRRDQAEALRGLSAKVRALATPPQRTRLDPDLEGLIAAEGLAARPGPRTRVAPGVLADLRLAVLGCRKVRLHYTRVDGTAVRQKVYPYGFLQGARPYLVAWSRPAGAHLLYRLSGIARVEVLAEPFERDPAFDLAAFAARSFGVFQEEPVDVVWRFAPSAADAARGFVFHPSQQLEDEPDGSLLVRFRAGGQLEMAWHFFTWGGAVEVLEPASLRELLAKLVADAGRHLGEP